ncbi:MAG TPA: amino acid permease [Candidatus Acidoferrales bacterium]|nr:amino acid permease [Candidatus Acidoferrales bacterium]
MEQKASQLRHELSAGQMAMVAVGGSIGVGLLLGSGAAVQVAGPGVILSYLLGAMIAFAVTMALGEMSSLHPAAGSFGVYADKYLGHWAGFVSRYGYWFSLVVAISADLVASAIYMRFWFPRVPSAVWIAGFAAVLLFINLRDVHDFGSFEYWFAMIKVVVIAAFILIGAGLMLGGKVPSHYTNVGGFLPRGAGAPLLALSFVLFNYLGTEMVAVSSGEARSTSDIVRATYITFGVLTFIYVCASAVLVGIVPWNAVGVTQSPFVTVFEIAHIPAVSEVINFVVLTAALSGANACLYVTSRMLYSLAESGYAPAKLAELSSTGSPRNALLVSASGIVIALVVQYVTPQNAFLYIIGASLVGGMLAWCIALASHVAMRRKLSREEIATLPMRAPGGPATSVAAFAGIVVAVALTWWVPQTRITIVTSAPYILLLTVFYLLVKRKRSRNKVAA